MSLRIKVMCALLILGCAGLFILKKPDGRPVLSIDEFLPDTSEISTLAQTLLDEFDNIYNEASTILAETENSDIQQSVEPANDSKIYRWKDNNGNWQFSDTPPSNQTAEAIQVSGDLNKDLSVTYTAPEKEIVSDDIPASAQPSSVLPMTVSPDKVSKLIEDANNIQKLMDDRADTLNNY
ncbi:DUF4124 domain-containing protein [Eionea flava]